jgi:hypothetical protein
MRPKAVQGGVFRSDDEGLLDRIKTIKTGHPFWGYRRVRAWLVHREKLVVNQKRVYRLMREHGLTAATDRGALGMHGMG